MIITGTMTSDENGYTVTIPDLLLRISGIQSIDAIPDEIAWGICDLAEEMEWQEIRSGPPLTFDLGNESMSQEDSEPLPLFHWPKRDGTAKTETQQDNKRPVKIPVPFKMHIKIEGKTVTIEAEDGPMRALIAADKARRSPPEPSQVTLAARAFADLSQKWAVLPSPVAPDSPIVQALAAHACKSEWKGEPQHEPAKITTATDAAKVAREIAGKMRNACLFMQKFIDLQMSFDDDPERPSDPGQYIAPLIELGAIPRGVKTLWLVESTNPMFSGSGLRTREPWTFWLWESMVPDPFGKSMEIDLKSLTDWNQCSNEKPSAHSLADRVIKPWNDHRTKIHEAINAYEENYIRWSDAREHTDKMLDSITFFERWADSLEQSKTDTPRGNKKRQFPQKPKKGSLAEVILNLAMTRKPIQLDLSKVENLTDQRRIIAEDIAKTALKKDGERREVGAIVRELSSWGVKWDRVDKDCSAKGVFLVLPGRSVHEQHLNTSKKAKNKKTIKI